MASESEGAMLQQWWRAARLFWGKQQWATALSAMRQCSHRDAVWLCSLFPDSPPSSARAVREVFLAQPQDARSLFFVAVSEKPFDRVLAWRAAQQGYGPAQALQAMACQSSQSRFAWSAAAAANDDPVSSLLRFFCPLLF